MAEVITSEEFVKALTPSFTATTRRVLGVTSDTFRKQTGVGLDRFLEELLTELYNLGGEPDPTEDSKESVEGSPLDQPPVNQT